MINKRAAIELSVNFLVTLIIAVVILGLGIGLVRTFFSQAGDQQKEISAQLQEEIANNLRGDNPVSIPYNSATIKRAQSKSFGVGILNILNGDKNFKIAVEDKTGLTSVYVNKDTEIIVKKGASHIEQVIIGVQEDATPGSYELNVKVTYQDQGQWKDYLTRKIYVTVE